MAVATYLLFLLAQPVEGEAQSPEINKTIQSEEIQIVSTEPIPKHKQKGTHGNLGQRNNNPLNITYGGATKHWVEERHAIKTQGYYKFLKFDTEENGWKAGEELLKGSYGEKTIEAAMRKWSSGGYGNEFGLPNKKIKDLTDEEFSQLVHNMASREGYFAK